MNLHVLSLDDWKQISANAHKLCFTEEQDPAILTCSYVLFVTDQNDSPQAYCTVLEMNTKAVYMQHGGVMPHLQNSVGAFRAWQLIINFLKRKYELLSIKIKNTNFRMLRIAMAEDMLITGLDSFGLETYLILNWGLNESAG